MELSLVMKLRVAAAVAVGIALIGLWAWPLAEPSEPFGIVTAASMNVGHKIGLLVLAAATGFVAYFLCWPYGKEIAILAVPAGLSIWALRSGSLARAMMAHPQANERLGLYAQLMWEPVYWLVVVAAGFAGIAIAAMLMPLEQQDLTTSAKGGSWLIHRLSGFKDFRITARNPAEQASVTKSVHEASHKETKPVLTLVKVAAVVAMCVAVAHVCIGIFARDVSIYDSRLGVLAAQPGVSQIAFAVFVSLWLAAFLVKVGFDMSYLWPIAACGFVTAAGAGFYSTDATVRYLADNLPAVLHPHPSLSILPIQIVAFGTLGSIAGFWSAVRYQYWRKNELK